MKSEHEKVIADRLYEIHQEQKKQTELLESILGNISADSLVAHKNRERQSLSAMVHFFGLGNPQGD